MRLFALYRGDEFIDVGTAEEIGARNGMKASSVKFMASPAYDKRVKYGAMRAYRLEDDEPDEPVRHAATCTLRA